MKQVTQTLRKGEVQIVDVPAPSLRNGGVLVRNAFSLISSGTERAKVELAQKSLLAKAQSRPDLVRQVLDVIREQSLGTAYRKTQNRLASLQPLGYSCSGRVVAVASDVNEFCVGDWVACAGGEFANHAEIVFVPKNLCVLIPRSGNGTGRRVIPEAGAFATVGSIALQGVRQADPKLGEVVVVVGLGLLGLLTIQLLEASGCCVLGLEPNSERCKLAASLGCQLAVSDPKQITAELRHRSGGIGADAVILTAASREGDLLAQAGEFCRERGRVVIVGDVPIRVPRSPYYEKELEVRMSRSYGPGRYDSNYEEKGYDYPAGYVRWTEKRNMEAFLELVAEGKVRLDPLVSHRFPVERAPEAYELLVEGHEPSLGILVEYPARQEMEKLNVESSVVKSPSYHRLAVPRRGGEIGVSLVGVGNFAQDILLPCITRNAGVRLRGVVSQAGLRARDVGNRFRFDYCATNIDDVLRDPDTKAVIIATRHDTHTEFVIRALQAGKAVFVEKPLAINAEQLKKLATLWNGILSSRPVPPCLMVGFNRRFAKATGLAREFLSGVREPLILSCRVNAGPLSRQHWLNDPEVGGGRIVGEGCHFVDLLMFLASSFPKEIHAQALRTDGQRQEENVLVQFRFANDSLATLLYAANGDKNVNKEYLEIFGAGTTVILDDFRKIVLSRPGSRQQIGGWWSKQDKGHGAEIKAFLEAVSGDKPSPMPVPEALRSTAATLSILESLRSRRPISLDESCFPVEGR